MKRPKVLLIAEAANPQWVSVPLVGWSHSQALRRVADVHLVTQVRNREALLGEGLREGIDFTAIDSERVAKPLHWLANLVRGGRGLGWTTVTAIESISYYYFEHLVWRRFGESIRAGEFDVVHRLTPLSPVAVSRIARRCDQAGVPFVLGPLNGGLPWPRAYQQARHREREWLVPLRGLHRWMPGYRRTRKHAAAIIAGSAATLEQVPAEFQQKCVYIPENAIDPDRFPEALRTPPTWPLRLAFVGRLVPYKNPDVVIEAVAPLARRGQIQLDIIGDGPMRGELERRVDELGLRPAITLRGWVDHVGVHERLARADVFAFPSIREFGGGVVLEAMAMGVVPIVMNYGGPGELVTDDCGWRLKMAPRERLIEAMRGIVERVVAEPSVLSPMREAAVRRVKRYFTWDAKAHQVLEVYDWVLGRREEKPDFGMPLGSRVAEESRKTTELVMAG